MKFICFFLIFIFQFAKLQICFSQWQICGGIDTVNTVTINCFATSGNNMFAGAQYGIYSSSNYGQNWTRIGLNNHFVTSVAILNSNIFAGTEDGVFASTNNGQNWSLSSLDSIPVVSIIIYGNNIFAAAYNGVYVSTNNGQNWSQTSLINQHITSLVSSGDNFFAGTEKNGVFFSSNSGQNWSQTSLNNYYIRSLSISKSNVCAGTSISGIFFSSNNGQNWTNVGLNNQAILAVTNSGNNIFASKHYYGIYFSSNNGQTWVERNEGFNFVPDIYSLFIFNNYIFAGGYAAWRRSLQEIIRVANISTEIPFIFSLSQNSPNPFNPTTKIKFDISQSGFTTLKIFDLTGKEIQTLVNEGLKPGVYEVEFEGSQLNSGIYFYRLTSGEYLESKKMILIK